MYHLIDDYYITGDQYQVTLCRKHQPAERDDGTVPEPTYPPIGYWPTYEAMIASMIHRETGIKFGEGDGTESYTAALKAMTARIRKVETALEKPLKALMAELTELRKFKADSENPQKAETPKKVVKEAPPPAPAQPTRRRRRTAASK